MMFVLLAIALIRGVATGVVHAIDERKTAPVPAHQPLEGQAGTAVLEFNGDSGARTAVTLASPIADMVVVCSGSDEWAVEADVSCQPLGDNTIGITAVMPYTVTHYLTVYWLAVERTQ